MKMSSRIAIAGIGCVGGFGCGEADFVAALKRGYTTALTEEKVHPDGYPYLPAFVAQTDALDSYMSKRELRRIDHYARMALLGGFMALEDAGIPDEQRERVGIIVATGYGATSTTFHCLESIIDGGDSCASPTNFSNSVHNVAAAYLSMKLSSFTPNLTVSQFDMSMSSALLTASCWLQQGRVDKVLIGGVDEHNAVLNDYCWQRSFGREAVAQQIVPFDFCRQSAISGEGAAFLVLSCSPEQAKYGYISAVDSEQFDADRTQSTLDEQGADIVLLGADGQQDTAGYYAQVANKGVQVSCAPCYGSLPVGQSFDLVAAALMLRDQSIYGLTARDSKTVDATCDGEINRITALKFARDGQLGRVTLSSEACSDA